ncbi:N-lysine methyltransferase SMYD2-B [Triplophysa dalaica]|uniref:N-lysine methyltransferase SMYD2-B n=1 Tax=Triplophysa dalaica TaxID=1582913 RepID=UPI0024DF7054|nr:N-lysine methyltransferase SMYD2-B [Triplophysa dalaica]XP_056620485.1 N-lysine methyltransferase SMYD2-B [Triplophysa dalaica]
MMKLEGIAGIEHFDSPGKGRGLRVNRAYGVGELLFSCPAYSYVLSVSERGFICEQCFTRKKGLAKCGKCKKAFYCNAKCQKKDWPVHKLECNAMCAFGEKWCPSETVRLVARIIARLRDQKERSQSEKLLLLKDMEAHTEELDNEKRERTKADIAGLHQFYSKYLDFPDHPALLTLFSQVHCNGFTLEDEELSHIGLAVFPDIALTNHSCCPNVIVTYRGINAEVRAVQDISPGQEIYISYIDVLYPTVDRIERLRDVYYFTCDCKECTTKSMDAMKMRVRKLSDEISQKDSSDMVRYARNAIEEFRRAKREKSPSELLEMCELIIDKMGSVFDNSNVYMLHMMYQAMGICLFTENYDGAVRYGEKVLKQYIVLYPAYSLNIASMYLKLGRLYIALDRKSIGISSLKKALAIMEVVHGKDHMYVASLKREISGDA